MILDTPLGHWLLVKRNTWFPAYRDDRHFYWRSDEEIHVYHCAPTSGFYHFSGATAQLPLDYHPVHCRYFTDGAIWTQKKYCMASATTDRIFPAGHEVSNTITDPWIATITLGSDRSVHLSRKVAACAWMVHHNEDQQARACVSLSGMSSLSSYRSKLEGIFRGLAYVTQLGINPQVIHQWCDNEAAVDQCNATYWTPGDMIRPDADILLTIAWLRTHKMAAIQVLCRHLYGHQDTQKRNNAPSPSPTSVDSSPSDASLSGLSLTSHMGDRLSPAPITAPSTLSLPARINIECDHLATETSDVILLAGGPPQMPPTLWLPYIGSRALLKIGGTWITSHYKRHILLARTSPAIRVYCCNKYGWSDETFNQVDWTAIRSVWRRLSAT